MKRNEKVARDMSRNTFPPLITQFAHQMTAFFAFSSTSGRELRMNWKNAFNSFYIRARTDTTLYYWRCMLAVSALATLPLLLVPSQSDPR